MCAIFCDPAGIQTQDLQNRNLTLYSAKLRSLFAVAKIQRKLETPKFPHRLYKPHKKADS